MAQIQLTIALVMIAMFTIAVIGFAINFGVDNNAQMNIANNPQLNTLNANATTGISTFSQTSNSTSNSILSTTIAAGSQSAPSVAPFVISITNPLGILTPLQAVFNAATTEFPVLGIFFDAIVAILIFMLFLLAYKTLRGFPE